MKRFAWLLAIPVAFFILACASPTPTGTDGDPIKAVQSTDSAQVTPPKVYSSPTATDFTLTLTELKRVCFGSAGCNVTFKITLTQQNAAEYDPRKTYKLTYTIEGAEDTYSNYLSITGKQYSSNEEEFVSVKSKNTKLIPTITQIIES